MFLLYKILISSFLFSGLIAFAEKSLPPSDVSPPSDFIKPTEEPPPPTPTPTNKTSTTNREGQKYMAAGQPLGSGPLNQSTSGVILGYYFDRDTLLIVDATNGTERFSDSNDKADGSSLGVHYKQFLGNTLYMRVGMDYRRMAYDYTSNDAVTRFDGSAISLGMAIGNQWQWSHFTMGCDWLGFSLPFTSSITSESTSGSNSQESISRLRTNKEKYLTNPSLQWLRLYFGASF